MWNIQVVLHLVYSLKICRYLPTYIFYLPEICKLKTDPLINKRQIGVD